MKAVSMNRFPVVLLHTLASKGQPASVSTIAGGSSFRINVEWQPRWTLLGIKLGV